MRMAVENDDEFLLKSDFGYQTEGEEEEEGDGIVDGTDFCVFQLEDCERGAREQGCIT